MQFFIFIRCSPGKTSEVGVAMAKKALPQVQEIYSVSGEWDLMVRANFEGSDDFESEVIDLLLADNWHNIQRTHTIVSYRVFSPDDVFF